MKLNKKVKDLAKSLGIEIRIANNPEDVDIMCEIPDNILAAYFPEYDIIFCRKVFPKEFKNDANTIVLHELSHGIFNKYKLKVNDKAEEVKANAGSLVLSAALNLKVSKKMLKRYEQYTKTKSLWFKI